VSTEKKDFSAKALTFGLVNAVILYFAAGALPLPDTASPYAAQMAAGITGFVATCWLASAIPLGAASLLPLALMPMLGVMPLNKIAVAYAHPVIWMLFGGFVLALGVERWNLHHRIALGIIHRVGVEPKRLVLGFMVASAFLSMWLSNTATTLLLLPIALALVATLKDAGGVGEEDEKNFSFTLLLGIAYAASLGGLGTPIGTAPNALYLSNYDVFEAQGAPAMSFLLWMAVAVPVVLIMIPLVWWLLTHILAPAHVNLGNAQEILDAESEKLPPMDSAERRMLGLFAVAAILWSTRRDIDLGAFSIPGWWNLFPVENAQYIGEGAISVLLCLAAFLIPSGRKPGQALINWETANKVPWDILLLIGGGIGIAKSFAATGLAEGVALALKPIAASTPALAMVILIAFMMTFLTEVTSNTATTALLLPILSSTAIAAQMDPRLLMLPATLSASCAFMLPIATPPNAIVFSSGKIPMQRMARVGFWINLLGVVVVSAVIWFIAVPLLGIDTQGMPAWAAKG